MAGRSVAIIGSGLGGLVAGNLLAKKGHNVTIFESHSAPGGYTAGFYRKGFYFESGTLSFEASPSIFKAMSDIGVLEKISFARHRMRWISDNIDCTPETYPDFKKMIYDAFPAEKDNLDKYFVEVDKMQKASSSSMTKPIPLLYSGVRLFLAIVSYLITNQQSMKITKQYSNMTAGEFNARYFPKGSKIYNLLSGFFYPNMAAWIIGGAFAMFEDYWTVSDGMQSWADILTENFKQLGGQIMLNSYVDKILTRNGAAIGVSSKGQTYDADYIIAACDYKNTFLKLLDDKSLITAQQQEKIRKAAVSEPVFTVYLGLNMSNEQLRKHTKLPNVAFANLKTDMTIDNSGNENFFENSTFGLHSPSLMNSKLAPEGKSSLMLQAMSPPGWMNDWGGADKQKYKQLKEKVTQTLIKRAETIVPGLGSHIELQDAATPLTYERYTHNSAGASSAWSWNPKKKFFKNTMDVNINTPVRNLYIGSCWAMQIGGVPGALIAAYACTKKVK
jgi:phytoene dehydrogenase-like protein